MAEVGNFMTLDAGDIHSILSVETGDIETVMGVEYPAGILTWAGGRHMAGGHSQTASMREIDYKSSTSSGNTADWGDLVYGGWQVRGAASGTDATRGIMGSRYGISTNIDDYDYMTVSSLGSAADGGDLVPDAVSGSGSSNGTLMFIMGGTDGSSILADMEYITIASVGTATNAGDMNIAVYKTAGCSGNTRGGRFGGITGNTASNYIVYDTNTVDYTSFHTTNNASSFGTLHNRNSISSACASATRWVHKSGEQFNLISGRTYHIRMDYWTADSGGTAGDFGDCDDGSNGLSSHTVGMSDGTRGEFWAGYNSAGSGVADNVFYITIASASNATDAGNLYDGIEFMHGGGFSGAAT